MKISIKEKLGYCFGEFAGSILWQTMMFFLPVFYTDVFLLPAASAATLFVVVRIFDALNDPIMGTIADRTSSRWGKFRPYLLFGSFPLLWSMLADAADYSEWKTGRRTTGLVYSAATFAQKTGVALGASLMMAIIGFYGYQANVSQTAESLIGIRICMTIVPALIAIAGTVLLAFYNLSDHKLKEIEKDLNQRRTT